MVGLIFAMEEEAACILKEYSFTKTSMRGRDFYVEDSDKGHDKIIVVISGVGKVNAQIATSILIAIGCNRIVNIGTCGSTGSKFKPGDLVEPTVFFDGDFDLSVMDISTKDPALVNREMNSDSVVCYTYSTFITDERASRGVVDMEAYGIVAQSKVFDTPVRVIKVVSDGGDVGEFESNVNSIMDSHINYIKAVIESDY